MGRGTSGRDEHKKTRKFFRRTKLEGEKTEWKTHFQIPVLIPLLVDVLHRHELCCKAFQAASFVG